MSYRFKIIIQARTNSSRLPKKVVRPIDGSLTFLHLLLNRLKQLEPVAPAVLATSTQADDDIIEEIGTELNVPVFRGSETDVLSRFIEAAQQYKAEHIIRVCSDNPFLDLDKITELTQAYRGEDYLSFAVNGTPSILTHYGFFAEIVSLNALRKLQDSGDSKCIEHVTNCIYTQPERFSVRFIPLAIEQTGIRCTLDTPADFENLKQIYVDWYKNAKPDELDYRSLINFVQNHPLLVKQMKQQIKANTK
jgi:spore coat polysaccharide biosynthesis protein SpsF